MKPGVVIGAGGTGKWVATYVARMALDLHQRKLLRDYGEAARQRPDWGELPETLDLFVVDVADSEKVPVEINDAFVEQFALDYSDTSPNFENIAQGYRQVVESIQNGTGESDYPQVARWLRRDDARCYKLDKLTASTHGGAGQLRQLARLSLFLSMQADLDVPNRIQQALQDVAKAWNHTDRVTIFITGSVAGGTGSGTLIDLAALVHYYAPQIFGDNFDVIGFVVLPTTFSTITKAGSDEMVRMRANSYAATRELMRFTTAPGGYQISFTNNLTVKVDNPLFSLVYLVEGTRHGGYDLQAVAPQLGTDPCVADAVLLHLSTKVDYMQIKTSQMQHPEGAYSVMGSVLYVMPAEEMIWEFGHELTRAALEALRWGSALHTASDIEAVAARASAEAIGWRTDFFESAASTNSPLNRWICNFLNTAKKPQLSTPVLMSTLRFNDRERDLPLPVLKLEDEVEVAGIGQIGEPPTVKSLAEEKVASTIGTPGDDISGGRRPTMWAVLSTFRANHQEAFRTYLASMVLEALNETAEGRAARPRRGGLQLAGAVLTSIQDYLSEFKTGFDGIYREQQVIPGRGETKLDRASREASLAEADMLRDQGRLRDIANNHGEQVAYLQRKQVWYDLTVQDLVASVLVSIIDDLIAITGDYAQSVNVWAASLRDDVTQLETTVGKIRDRRREAARVQVRQYISEPEDAFETALLAEHAGASSASHLADSTAVDGLLSQMGWTWDDPADPTSLLLGLPEVPGRPVTPWKREDWARDGAAIVQLAAMPTFEPIRRLTIWDALIATGTDAATFRNEVGLRSAPITAVDDQQQQRSPAIHTIDQEFVVANWLEAQSDDMAGSPRRLSSDLRASLGNAAVPWDDPHRILGVTLRHLIKLGSLSCVPQLRDPYQRLLTGIATVEGTEGRVPLHLFPGEQLAAELEQQSLNLLDEQVTIPVELVGLLEDGDALTRFARAIAFDKIHSHRDRETGDLVWITEGDGGATLSVAFGSNASEACANFSSPPSPSMEQTVVDLMAKVRAVEDAMDDASYVQVLRTKAQGRLIPESDSTESALREGLDRTLRMLLSRHASKMQ
ncbi:MAG: tubulin-like doman-containing protein [Acidimicrobiia bacterium]